MNGYWLDWNIIRVNHWFDPISWHVSCHITLSQFICKAHLDIKSCMLNLSQIDCSNCNWVISNDSPVYSQIIGKCQNRALLFCPCSKHECRYIKCPILQTAKRRKREKKTHTHQWPLLNLVPLSEAQTANERAQRRPFKFIWTDVIKLTHGVGWILGRLLPKLSFPKHCHLPSLQMNQLQSSIILLGLRWMHTSSLAGAHRLRGLFGAGDIKEGVLSSTL